MGDQAERSLRVLLPGSTGEPVTHGQFALFGNLFDELDVGVILVDPGTDFASVNRTAAELLNIDSGTLTATRFAAIINDLAARALNRGEIAGLLKSADGDPSVAFQSTWSFAGSPTHLGVVSKPAPYLGIHGRIWAFYDNSMVASAVDSASEASALIRASSDAMLDPQVVLEAVWHDGHVVDLINRDVNRAACEYFGLPREQIVGRRLFDSAMLEQYACCAETGEPVILDAVPHSSEIFNDLRYYDIRATQVRTGTIILTWRDVTERIEDGQHIAASEQQFRMLAENMGDVVTLVDDDGTITWVSNSVEQVLGAPAGHWLGRHIFDFGPTEDAGSKIARWREIVAAGTYIGRNRVFSADGTRHTAHIHSKPFLDADGTRKGIVLSFRIIDDEVAVEDAAREQISGRDERNRELAQDLRDYAERLESQLNSAARYMRSILPGGLDGTVAVTARYLPSAALSGDCYDFRWLDDDHLMAYLVDVSGHGVEPALLSVSVHNVLRSGSIDGATLLNPGAVLTELNRLFQMDRQGGLYFTIWYGVYQASTRNLRFSCAGHPPALMIADGAVLKELSTGSIPVGVAEAADFDTRTCTVPAGADILVYSDGVLELGMPEDEQMSPAQFGEIYVTTAQRSDWTLDTLTGVLKARSDFQGADDCTLVRLHVS